MNFITTKINNFKAASTKGKIWRVLLVLFILFCIRNFFVGFNKDGLPECGDSIVTKEQIPQILKGELVKRGLILSKLTNVEFLFSEIEETYYNKNSGVRQCEANMTMRLRNNVEANSVAYQIAWTNKEKGEYQIKIED